MNQIEKVEASPYEMLLQRIEEAKDAIGADGPCSGEKMIVRFRQAVQANPELIGCTPQSVISALCLANRLDVDFSNPYLAEAYLSHRTNKKKINGKEKWFTECVLGLMYAGRAKVAIAAGAIKDVYAVPVFQDDEIQITLGLDHAIKHNVSLDTPTTFDRLIGCYAVVVFPDGSRRAAWYSIDKINSAKAAASEYAKPWKHPHNAVEMAKKTGINNILKSVPRTGADLPDGDDEDGPVRKGIEHNAELERQIVESAGKELPPAMIDGEPIDVDKIGQQWTPEEIAAIDNGGDTRLF